MQVFYDQDSSYFKINLLEGTNVSQDVVSIDITEEMGKYLTGSITFYDPSFQYCRAFKAGIRFELEWGYKNRNQNVFTDIKIANSLELIGPGIRRGQQCIITNSTWNASDKGVMLYTVNFYSSYFLQSTFKSKVFSSGSRLNLIQLLFADIGIVSSFIKFDSQTTILNQSAYEVQNESSFKMLNRLATEWRCLIQIGYSASGQGQGLFINSKDVGGDLSGQFNSACVGGIGNSKILSYGSGNDATNPNVISYSACNHVGDNGQGNNAQISFVGNKPIITRYISQKQTVETLQLDDKKVKEFAETHSTEAYTIIQSAVSAGNLQTTIYKNKRLIDFFTVVKSETAPQGTGFTINAEMIGDTSFTVPIQILPLKGFPPNMSEWTEISKFFLKKVSHKLSTQGYKMSVEISDAITAFKFQEEPK